MITNRDIQIETVNSAVLKLFMLNLPASTATIQAHTRKPQWCKTWSRWVAMIKQTVREG
jgi:hypothetical protein